MQKEGGSVTHNRSVPNLRPTFAIANILTVEVWGHSATPFLVLEILFKLYGTKSMRLIRDLKTFKALRPHKDPY